MSPPTDRHGQVTVITGAAGGIGAAIAARVLNAGNPCLLVDRDPDALERTAETLVGPVPVVGVAGDIREDATLDRVIAIAEADGCVGLVHVAGIGPVQTDDPLEILDVNLRCVDRVTAALRPAMSSGASIVTIGSVASRRAETDADDLLRLPSSETWFDDWRRRDLDAWSAYAYSKRGVRLHAMSIATAWALDGIRANVVSPSQTATALGLSSYEEDEAIRAFVHSIPMQRMATPAEVAAVVSFLLGSESSFVTGVEVFVDGGASAAGSLLVRDDPLDEVSPSG